jgi:diguanylate cyclase (GGDEF)-like protein
LFYANLSYEWLGPTIFVSAGGAFLMLYLHDRRQAAALRISAAYFCSLIGYATVMMVGGELRPSYQALILFSVLSGNFLLVWGVAGLFGKAFPRKAFGLAVLLVAGLVVHANASGASFMQRFANLSGFSLLVNLICCSIVWRARHQLVDNVIAALFLLQAALILNRIAAAHLLHADLLMPSAFKQSGFASALQTENAIFAILIGLALFTRNSMNLVTRLRRLAETDPLTSLLNRRAFETRVKAMRDAVAPLPTGLIICDIDHFKRVNDCHGHEVGDRALKAFARLLQKETPETAICTRLGGEEFCILLAGVDDQAIRLQALHLRSAVERLQVPTGTGSLRLTASFGYARLEPGFDLTSAMMTVDGAVYQAKNDGRNLVRAAILSPAKSVLAGAA